MMTPTKTISTLLTTNKDITDLATKLDRYIFAQRSSDAKPITVGLAVAAIGTLLASKPTNPENNERMIQDMVNAIRAAYHERFNKDG